MKKQMDITWYSFVTSFFFQFYFTFNKKSNKFTRTDTWFVFTQLGQVNPLCIIPILPDIYLGKD